MMHILFTWVQCSDCSQLKKYLYRDITTGDIVDYDLDDIEDDDYLSNLFSEISPNGTVPALVIVTDDDDIHSSAIGIIPILKLLGK